MDNLPIIIGVVAAVLAVVAVLVLLLRPKPLPPAPVERPKPEAPPPAKPREKREAAKPPVVVEDKREKKEPEPPPEVPAPEELVAPPAAPPPVVTKTDVAGLRRGLAATRGGFIARLKSIFTGHKEIDPTILEQLEEVMLTSDVGVKTTQAILERLRDQMNKSELSDTDAVWAALRAEATRILSLPAPALGTTGGAAPKPTVILMVGVNGVGKTTTIGKLATKWNGDGKRVMLAAGDTFRAAAVQQLEVWGKRVGAEVVKGKEGADPGSVAYEATKKSAEDGADFLLVDTAGRLHTKVNLMDEIKKVKRTIGKALDGAPHETLLVIDATTGQNALTQAAMFKEALELTGLILTKLDGTAKGGVVLGVCDELKVPVRYIGLGERAEDLREFVATDFVEALFGKEDEAA